MKDRLSRRKKKTDEAPAPDAPAPIQPHYYEAQPEGSTSAETSERAEAPVEEIAPRAVEEPASSDPEPGNEATPDTAATGVTRRRRRRGRRGGRGGSRGGAGEVSKTAPTAAPLQPTLMREEPDKPMPARHRAAAPVAKPAVPAPSHPPKGVVVLSIGLPGSGKSAWFKRNNITPLSSDLLRALLFDDPTEQRFQDLVFSNLRSMLRARLVARRPMNYVDATNLTPHERQSWIKLAHDYGYEVHAVFFDVPVEVCLERNQRRQRQVPEEIVRKMAAKLKPPAFEEGFTKVTVVRVKKKDEGTEGEVAL